MPVCDGCGRDAPVARTFTVAVGENVGRFDSVQCAITVMAPRCPRCCCRVLGHGADGHHGLIFCCEHCRDEWGTGPAEVTGAHSR